MTVWASGGSFARKRARRNRTFVHMGADAAYVEPPIGAPRIGRDAPYRLLMELPQGHVLGRLQRHPRTGGKHCLDVADAEGDHRTGGSA